MRFVARRFTVSQCNVLDALVVPSRAMEQALVDYGVRCPMHIIPTGMEMERFAGGDGGRFRAQLGIAPGQPVLVHVGRIAHEKNIEFLFRMFALVVRAKPGRGVHRRGRRPGADACKAYVRSLGIEQQVRFVGYLSRERELLDCYRAGDLFVFSSKTETQGLVLLEAMALGVPVVSTAHMGTADIVNPQRGAHAAPDDEGAFASIVVKLLEDPPRRAAMSAEARAYAATWSASAMADRLAGLYSPSSTRHRGTRPSRNPYRLGSDPAHFCLPGCTMRWEGRRESQNVEDRRGMRFGRAGGIGLGTIVLALVAAYFGVDPSVVLQGMQPSGRQQQGEQVPYNETPEEAQKRKFVSVVLADTEDAWTRCSLQPDAPTRSPSSCCSRAPCSRPAALAEAAVGPFYCPGDRQVYIDLSLLRRAAEPLRRARRFRAGLRGRARSRASRAEAARHLRAQHGGPQRASQAKRMRCRCGMELQADCFAGIWAHNADRSRQLLEAGDIEEGLNAAAAIGDDRLQKQSRGYVSPESFTHGSSEQRVRWFKRGFESGPMESCDTFGTRNL